MSGYTCRNPRCREHNTPPKGKRKPWTRLCPSCRLALRSGLLIGGILAGLIGGLLKLWAKNGG